MGGRLRFEERPGGGATAVLEIPYLPSSAAPPCDGPAEPNPTVLVVDDNQVNRLVLRRMLGGMGCTVELAENGAEALERLDGATFDLVLMDCEMPIPDGFGATAQARSRGDRTPIVAVTAYTSEAEFLAKRVVPSLLSAVVQRFTARAGP
ncbi:MAG: response regulator [Myxococcota bacterium]